MVRKFNAAPLGEIRVCTCVEAKDYECDMAEKDKIYIQKCDELIEMMAAGDILRKELEAANEKVLRVVRGEFTQVCSCCGEEMSQPSAWEKLENHVQKCPKHPLYKLRQELEAARQALKEIASYRSDGILRRI